MADGYARVTGRVGVCSVHQGPGLTNTMTGLTEAAKSRTPVLVLAGETPSGGADLELQDRPARPGRVGRRDRRPGLQPANRRRRRPARLPSCGASAPAGRADAADRHPATARRPGPQPTKPPPPPLPASEPSDDSIKAAADLLENAKRPAIIAGRGAVLADARDDLELAGPADRRRAGDLGPGQRPVRRVSPTRSGSRAVSRPRLRPSCCRAPTSCSRSAPRSTTGRLSTAR